MVTIFFSLKSRITFYLTLTKHVPQRHIEGRSHTNKNVCSYALCKKRGVDSLAQEPPDRTLSHHWETWDSQHRTGKLILCISVTPHGDYSFLSAWNEGSVLKMEHALTCFAWLYLLGMAWGVGDKKSNIKHTWKKEKHQQNIYTEKREMEKTNPCWY